MFSVVVHYLISTSFPALVMPLDTEERQCGDIKDRRPIPNDFIDEDETSDINGRARIPAGGFIEHKTDHCDPLYFDHLLPKYRTDRGWSPSCNPLTLTDCHTAMKVTLGKARLIVFEIARQNRPFHRRHLETISLSGSMRGLDKTLLSTFSMIDDLLDLRAYILFENSYDRMDCIFGTLLVAHGSFKDSSSTQYLPSKQYKDINILCSEAEMIIAPFKKVFVQNVLQTLKQALIEKFTPDFTALVAEVGQCSIDILQACRERRNTVTGTCYEIKGAQL